MSRYEVDKDFNLKKVTHSVGGMLVTSLKWLIATVSLAAFYYVFWFKFIFIVYYYFILLYCVIHKIYPI